MILGVIPARYASSRFPGKVLADLGGKPMLWHVWQRCLEAGCLDRILVATDDARIGTACDTLGIEHLMTRSDHLDCLDRVCEVAERIAADRYVCVQGDEPFVSPEAIRALATCVNLPACGYADVEDARDVPDATVPKVVVTRHPRICGENLVYISRAAVPYPSRRILPMQFQVCVYAFDTISLQLFSAWAAGPVERQESIGLLRYLEHGHTVWMVKVPPSPVSVDVPADLERAREILAQRTG